MTYLNPNPNPTPPYPTNPPLSLQLAVLVNSGSASASEIVAGTRASPLSPISYLLCYLLTN